MHRHIDTQPPPHAVSVSVRWNSTHCCQSALRYPHCTQLNAALLRQKLDHCCFGVMHSHNSSHGLHHQHDSVRWPALCAPEELWVLEENKHSRATWTCGDGSSLWQLQRVESMACLDYFKGVGQVCVLCSCMYFEDQVLSVASSNITQKWDLGGMYVLQECLVMVSTIHQTWISLQLVACCLEG